MRDVVLVTADSVRRDFVDAMPFVGDHEVLTGVAAGHYTRPSLAALQSGQLRAAVETRAIGPTLAGTLAAAGYRTVGLVPSAQADPAFGLDAGFDYYDNYVSGGGRNPRRNRASWLREFVGSFDLVRQLYRRFYPMSAIMDDLPDDGSVVDEAIERFNASGPPRFLWVHQMGSHRPYGTGEAGLPEAVDRKAQAAGGRDWLRSGRLTEAERTLIRDRYRDALGRVDDRIRRLLDGIDAEDPVVAFAADHGEEFGEDGYYYHQGYRRRVVDTLLHVPVVFRDVETVGNRCSLLDVAPTLAGAAGVDPPAAWSGNDLRKRATRRTVTVAPWNDIATVAWQGPDRKLVARDAGVSLVDHGETIAVGGSDVPADLRERLQDLGYRDAG